MERSAHFYSITESQRQLTISTLGSVIQFLAISQTMNQKRDISPFPLPVLAVTTNPHAIQSINDLGLSKFKSKRKPNGINFTLFSVRSSFSLHVTSHVKVWNLRGIISNYYNKVRPTIINNSSLQRISIFLGTA